MKFIRKFSKPDIPATKKLGKLVIEGINCTKFPNIKCYLDVDPEADPAVYKFTYIRYDLYSYFLIATFSSMIYVF